MLKEKIQDVYHAIDQKFQEQFGFRIKETTFLNIVRYLHSPKDSSSLAVTRILFGFLMLFDIPHERGGSRIPLWGKDMCHFPLIPFITAMPMRYMGIVYAAMWLGALGIMLGYKYRTSSIMFTVTYWYLFLIEKSVWNNHSYLFGLVGFLLACTQANCYWSLDIYLAPSKEKYTVPYWNYFLLKYQFFILYFVAGLKKGTAEWLDGYSVQNLAEHWVFDPFKLFLTVSQIDYLIVHCFIFAFDLTVAMWMMWERTRHVAMVFCAMFHFMNSRLFTIGMFPWVCLATMPLYYPFDWPKTLGHHLKMQYYNIKAFICNIKQFLKTICNHQTKNDVYENEFEDDDVFITNVVDKPAKDETNITNDKNNVNKLNCLNFYEKHNYPHDTKENDDVTNVVDDDDQDNIGAIIPENMKQNNGVPNKKRDPSENSKTATGREKLTTCMIMLYVFIQAFLPYSHFITKGYNNWTNGLYGYSWDMMVHSWHIESAVVKIVDIEKGQEMYLDVDSGLTPNDRWKRSGDMVYQLSKCLQQKMIETNNIPRNMSIFVDIWCSMNGRFTQRMFDPKVDLLKASWSPFESVSFLMPVLDEALHWRSTLRKITEEVYSYGDEYDVIFFADFPGYQQEKFIPEELNNVTLTVLEGVVAYEPEDPFHSHFYDLQTHKLVRGDSISVESGLFHRILNIGIHPVYYMYTFTNKTRSVVKGPISKLPIFKELYRRFYDMAIFAGLVRESISQIIFGCNGKC